MICPHCNNPGIDIIESLTLVATKDWTPPIKREGVLSCPCGAFFDWRSRDVLIIPENVIPEWWTQLPAHRIIDGLELSTGQYALLSDMIDHHNVKVVPFGDNRYFYLIIPDSTGGYTMLRLIDRIRGVFQSWQHSLDAKRCVLLIQYR